MGQPQDGNQAPATPESTLAALERAEKLVIAASFLVAKVVSVVALLLALIVLEAGVVKGFWRVEFGSEVPPHPTSPKNQNYPQRDSSVYLISRPNSK
jgi:hypothetical protein